jgi:hypothetical protein
MSGIQSIGKAAFIIFVLEHLSLTLKRQRNWGTLLELAGELLPLSHKGKKYYLMNVLECANCLDERSTQWKSDKETRVPIRILKYEFRSDRFPESTFFKIVASAPAIEGASPFMCARQAVLATPSKPPHPT